VSTEINNDMYGMPVFGDQVSDLIDLLLSVEGIRQIYMRRHDHSWIESVGNQDLRDGLLQLTGTQTVIIEAVIFDNKNIADIKDSTGMTGKQIRIEIRKMRKTLLSAI